jgi:hypothetical protein
MLRGSKDARADGDRRECKGESVQARDKREAAVRLFKGGSPEAFVHEYVNRLPNLTHHWSAPLAVDRLQVGN